jgi:outer membrane lipoprotein-sorting protein
VRKVIDMKRLTTIIVGLSACVAVARANQEPSAAGIVQKVLLADPWGLSGAEVSARALLIDKKGSQSEIAFGAKSKQHSPPLTKSILRFSAPSELAGAGFLQIQRSDGDDDRFLFLPELKRSRRVSGTLRSGAFMGTDFTFADLDRRDLRESSASLRGRETIGKYSCYVVDVVSKRDDSPYSHVEISVREDNFLPLRMKMYDHARVLFKTFEAQEVKRVSGAWFISKSKMLNHLQKHSTELVLEKIEVKSDFPDDEFTVRALEKS